MLLAKAYRPDPRVYKEAMTLSKNGFDVSILCWDREGKCPKYKKEANIEIFSHSKKSSMPHRKRVNR